MDRKVEDEKKLKQGEVIILKGVVWGGVIIMNRTMQKQSMGLKITH